MRNRRDLDHHRGGWDRGRTRRLGQSGFDMSARRCG
jgi:hypothetical protein